MQIPKKAIILIYLVSAGLFGYSISNINWDFRGSMKADIKDSFDNYAQKIVERCSEASYKPGCYEEEVPKLMEYISMEEAFRVTRLVQDKDTTYQYCHVLGHKLSAMETAKDPSNWKEVMTRCPSGLCSNGCIHGAFQERFRSETLTDSELDILKEDLKNICEPRTNWNPTGLEQGTCYHALGHLLMYVSGANIDKSAKICEEVAKKSDGHDWSQLCFDGVFMQIFQPLETEDFALIAGKQPKKEGLVSFCSKFSKEKKASCWSESWPLYFNEIMKPKGLLAFCSSRILPKEDQDRCFSGMFYVITAQLQFDLEKVRTYCMDLPQAKMDRCFANAASRLIETDYRNIPKVVNFCSSIEQSSSKEQCYRELIGYSTYNFHKGSEEFFSLCNSLPETYKNECFNGLK